MLKELSVGVHELEHKAWKCFLLLGSSVLSKQSSKEV